LEILYIFSTLPLDWVPEIKTLKKLFLFRLDTLEDIRKFPHLNSLSLFGSFTNLSGLEDCKEIESLTLVGCLNLDDISAIQDYTTIKELIIANCPQVERVPSFKSLTRLVITGDNKIEDYNFLSECTNLTTLMVDLRTARPYIFYYSIANLQFLETLEISRSEDVKFPYLPNLVNLKSLSLYDFSYLESFIYLRELPKLEKLHLYEIPKLKDFVSLAGCASLKELSVENCTDLHSLTGLEFCTNLNTLIIENCPDLGELDTLQLIKGQLIKVRISGTQLFVSDMNEFADTFPGWRAQRLTLDDGIGSLITYGL
jgi:hypothetical protein